MKLSAWKMFFVLAVGLSSLIVSAQAYEEKSGTIGNETWGTGTVFVTGTVEKQGTLTLLPGTVVKFKPGTTLAGDGQIQAIGTSSSPIVLTSMNDDSVGEVLPGSSGSPAAGDWASTWWRGTSVFEWCRIRFGTSVVFWDNAGWYFGQTVFRHCEISDMSEDGAYGWETRDGYPRAEFCRVHDCQGDGIRNFGTVVDCELTNCRWGVVGDQYGGGFYTYCRNVVRNTQCGLWLVAWYNVPPSVVEDNILDGNGFGIYFHSGYGFTALYARRNRIVNSTFTGIYADGAASERNHVIEDNLISGCGTDGIYGFRLNIRNCLVEECDGWGILGIYDGGHVERNTVRRCGSGIGWSYAGWPVEIQDNTITDCDAAGIYYATPYWSGPNPSIILRRNTISHIAGNGIAADYFGGGSNLIEDNVVTHCGGHGIYGTTVRNCVVEDCGGIGIVGYWGGGLLERNTVKRCNDTGIVWLYANDGANPVVIQNNIVTGGGGGIFYHTPYWNGPGPGIIVRNNTIAGNGSTGMSGMYVSPDTTHLYSNIIASNAGPGFWSQEVMTGDYNLFFGNGTDDYNYIPGSHDLSADPRFVNAAAGDYHLLPDSPAIDAGAPEGPTEDLEGNTRPADGNGDGVAKNDIGCYEVPFPAIPPRIVNVTATPDTLWPPNHQMVNVQVSVQVEDRYDPAPTVRIISVTSNEPVNGLGDGDTAPDWQMTGDLTVKLRAERSGTGGGRVYTITVEAVNRFGLRSMGTVQVKVPRDKGSGKGGK